VNIALRVVARFQRNAAKVGGVRQDTRDLIKPINSPKGISKETLRDYVTTEVEPGAKPNKHDITPSDVFQPQPKNMNVLNLALSGWPGTSDDYTGMERAIRKQIPKDKGYDTVSNLSQYLVETDGGGDTKAVGKK
jgi:hypothetical protein